MKLLFDENLSYRLASALAVEFPNSIHVRDVGMNGIEDSKIWDYGKENDFIIVSKDSDFRERSFVEGFPPKIIWLDVGNAGTQNIIDLLKQESLQIKNFETQTESSILILSFDKNST